MELKLISIADKNDIANERIGIKVLKDCDLKNYLLFKTYFTEKGFFNESDNAYWFTPRKVMAGDKVVIYSKVGNVKTKDNTDGSTTHFIYWGLSSPVFTSEKQGVVLAKIDDWSLSNKLDSLF